MKATTPWGGPSRLSPDGHRVWGLAAAALCVLAALPAAQAAEAPPTCRGRPATIVGSEGDDVLVGTAGPDVIVGLGGDDVLTGGGGRDVLCGGDGDDLLRGGPGRDVLVGGEGADRLTGGPGIDLLLGGSGDDRLSGGRDADELRGGPGSDRLSGGGGADVLFGGADRDRADGGPGLDSCLAERRIGCGVSVAPACPSGVGCGEGPAPGVLAVPLVVAETSGVKRVGSPVTSGIPIPREVGLVTTSDLRLLDASGRPVAAQLTPVARWGGAPDDASAPVRWLLLDFPADVPAGGRAAFLLVGSGGATAEAPPLTVTDDGTEVAVETGAARYVVSRDDGRLNGPGLVEPTYLRLLAPDGTVAESAGPATVSVASTGPLRAEVEVSGWLRDGTGRGVLGYTARYWFYAGRAEVRLFLTVENRNACPLGADAQISCHALGSAGSRRLDDLSLVVPAAVGPRYLLGGETGSLWGDLIGPLLLHQGSSGTRHWNHYATLADWDGTALNARPRLQAYATERGYRATLDGRLLEEGDHAPGLLAAGGAGGWSAVEVADFWEQFPKSLRAAPGGSLEVGLFPGEYGPPGFAYTLRAGEHKTHEVWLRWSGGDEPPEGGEALMAAAPAGWYVGSGAVGHIALADGDWPDYEEYLAAQLDRAPGYEGWMGWYPDLPEALEATDFYGIGDFGDWPIDYEGYGVAPLNLKYDANWGAWVQWMRTGDPRWYELAEAGNRHFADADVLHTLHSPRHWSDGIAFGHSYHDETGFENPHRNYGGTHPDTASGPEGLLLTYYLTGYPPARAAALEVADCIEYR
ncbi:MAG: hypothetical protein JW785_07185, partial [Acidimicrobiia bacterium]|nr:hypothetical protein [Acidimicrobiia bacterium]